MTKLKIMLAEEPVVPGAMATFAVAMIEIALKHGHVPHKREHGVRQNSEAPNAGQ